MIPSEKCEELADNTHVFKPKPSTRGSDETLTKTTIDLLKSLSSKEEVYMSHPKLTSEEVAQRGKDLYEQHIRSQVETANNIGKLVSIDVETGKYEVGDDLLVICQQLQLLHPGAAIWTERIGFNAVYAVGGTLVRTTP
jgi:hypothetical protein